MTTDVQRVAVGAGRRGVRLETPAQLRALMRTDFTFSDPQWEAVSAPLRPGVIVAGAGSGKTAVMAARVVYLVATGQVAADQVLGLTFTTKATAELGQRIRSALAVAGLDHGEPTAAPDGQEAPERTDPVVSTYNAYAASLLTEHGLRIGFEPDTRVMADASRYQVAAAAVAAHTGTVTHLTESPAHAIEALLGLEAELNEHLVTPAQLRAWQARERPAYEAGLAAARGKAELTRLLTKMSEREELLDLVEGYRRLKTRLGLMDFSDQIALAAELARTQPEVARAEREKYRVVLLDEYQDTSVAQAQLLAALYSGASVETGLGHPVTAVGDPNQAIYGWRGASVSNILRFDRSFPASDGPVRTHSLVVSQRSDQRVVAVANALAEPLYDAAPQVAPLQAREAAGPGVVRVPRHATYADELTWLAGQVVASRAAMPAPSWAQIGVLTRDNAHAADVFDALTAADVPVEIVGLKGLMRLPEVSEVVSTLALLDDLAANADLLNLLTGPRWAIGPRDLSLLGRRVRELTGRPPRPADGLGVVEELQQAVEDADPTELVCLGDALADPGPAAYSQEARDRFGLLAGELRALRQHVGDPLPDLVRRIVDTTGIDVELASSVSPAAQARRDNLDLFLEAVADFQAYDGRVTLTSLLAWLQAEEDGGGLDQATPSEADSVKLLTVHRAKGLEYAAVFLVGVSKEKFPVETARSQWTTVGRALPAPLRGDRDDVPQVRGHEKADLVAYQAANKDHQQVEELRLGYVALTRAKHELWVSSYQWSPTRKKPLAPSPYQVTVRATMIAQGWPVEEWPEEPQEGAPNPLLESPASHPWPTEEQSEERRRRAEAAARVRAVDLATDDPELDVLEAARVAQWDAEIDRLLVEAREERADVVDVPVPAGLSATALLRLRADPAAYAGELARPMPRPPAPPARLGTRFHAWVEARFGQQSLLDADELPGRGDLGIDDEDDLAELVARFDSGPFGERAPHATEAPFSLVLDGHVVRGRIDAVYAEPDGSWLVVDWKTQRQEAADPTQLAVYRLAWAELQGVEPEQVRAAFHYVRSGRTQVVEDLAGRAELERLLAR